MPRKPRIFTETGVYHITTRGNNRQDLFQERRDYLTYLGMLGLLKQEYRFEIYHYCLMTNHTHLLIRFNDSQGLQKVMQRVNLVYAKYFRRQRTYCGHVFQDRFKSFPVEDDAYLLDCGRYIERNPLKAGLAKDIREYSWSSYPFYAEGQANALLTPNPLYLDLGDTSGERQSRYQEYVLTHRPYEKLIDQGLGVWSLPRV